MKSSLPPMNQPENVNADQQQQLAFQQFMLHGKGNKKVESSVSTTPVLSSKTKHRQPQTSTTPNNNNNNNNRKQQQQSLRPIIKAFQGRLDDWDHTDQQVEKVVHSIWNLRTRLAWECEQLQQQQQDEERHHSRPWQGSGFRPTTAATSCCLLVEDVHMALDHDLLQHERMMATLRSLMASLAQTLDAASRRLEEWILHASDDNEWCYNTRPQEASQRHMSLLSDTKQLYFLLAQDLYQKQLAVQNILQSSHDGILNPHAPVAIAHGTTPQQVVKRALELWSTSSDRVRQKKMLMDRLLKG
ncbi:hypothetical protein IV203_022429 [Nitzschia inconspicua]|uniref:Uncharacterized protein n=1 Tax=Nitzschia inconspicua TaxID=303405 RepID=A0A9K3K715_9STRA|nr:hypothetical protein IV203_024588 [Nitzschia inconspicua]KAG7344421.1 hypothetical protein IV203_022429 [Nitzschia inconspicua]